VNLNSITVNLGWDPLYGVTLAYAGSG
jgi:hypothetical protein